MKSSHQTQYRQGFTLKEVFYATSIMFLGTALVIPVMAMRNDFEAQRNKTNAGQMVAFFDAAKHKGVNLLVGADPLPTVIRMINGASVAEKGSAKRQELKLNAYTQSEIDAALPYLTVDAGNLRLRNSLQAHDSPAK